MFLDENVDVLYEGTSQEVLARAAEFFDGATTEDDVLFYFSGHAEHPAKDDLILCARDTRSHSSSILLSSGVPSTSLSKMIERSDAANVVIILDCCFSGSFKGHDHEAFDELKGTGRYVLAATEAVELAEDAPKGQPSPFTRAIVQGLMSVSRADSTSTEINLDALYSFVDDYLPKNGPRPRRGYDGSGTVIISRAHGVRRGSAIELGESVGEDAAFRPTSSSSASGEATERHARESWRPARRLPGDLSIADTRIWMVISALAIAAACCFWVAYFKWPLNYYESPPRQDPHRYIVFPCILACAVIAICSITEGYFYIRRSRNARSRREILQIMGTRPITVLHRVREIVSYLAVIGVLATLFGYQNTDITWILGLSLLGIFAIVSVISSLRQGDALYLSGASLFVVSAFLPASMYGNKPEVSLGTASIFEIILGALMIAAWWFKAPRGALILAGVACLLPLVTEFAETPYSDVVGPYAGLVGIAVAVVSWVLGTGQQLNPSDEQSFTEQMGA